MEESACWPTSTGEAPLQSGGQAWGVKEDMQLNFLMRIQKERKLYAVTVTE